MRAAGGSGPVAPRPTSFHPGRSLADEPFEGAVCVGTGKARRPSDGVPGAGAVGQEYLIDCAFSGGETERGKIELGHT